MTKFRFRAATADGTVITGVESSTAIGDLRARLLDRNLQPISILEKKSILQVEITQKKVKKRELMHLCRQLAVFLRSGVSVLEALVILADETSNKVMKSALEGIRLSLESGARFSEAAAEHQELFPTYAIEILRLRGTDREPGPGARPAWRLPGTRDRHQPAGPIGDGLPACGHGPGPGRLDGAGRLRAAEVPRLLLVPGRQAAPAHPDPAGPGQVDRRLGVWSLGVRHRGPASSPVLVVSRTPTGQGNHRTG